VVAHLLHTAFRGPPGPKEILAFSPPQKSLPRFSKGADLDSL
jgi:hypothetical protein